MCAVRDNTTDASWMEPALIEFCLKTFEYY